MDELPFDDVYDRFEAAIDLEQDEQEITNCGDGLSDFVKQLECGTSNRGQISALECVWSKKEDRGT